MFQVEVVEEVGGGIMFKQAHHHKHNITKKEKGKDKQKTKTR